MGVAEAPVEGPGTLQATPRPPSLPPAQSPQGPEDCRVPKADVQRDRRGPRPLHPSSWEGPSKSSVASRTLRSHTEPRARLPPCKPPRWSASDFTLHPGWLPPWPPHPPANTSEEAAGTGAPAGCTACPVSCGSRAARHPPRPDSASGLLARLGASICTGRAAGRPASRRERERS